MFVKWPIKSKRVKRTNYSYFLYEYPLVPHRAPQFNASVQHKNHTFPAPKIPQFHTNNSSVQHQSLPIPHTPQVNTNSSSVQHTPQTVKLAYIELFVLSFLCWTEGLWVLNWGACWNEWFLVWNWGVFGVELRVFEGWERVDLLCWTERGVELRETLFCMNI